MTDDLIELLQTLDARLYRDTLLRRYFEGASPLSFLSRDAKIALRQFDSLSSNLCRTAVVSLQERLRLSGISGTDAWSLFEYSDLDQLAAQVHGDALLYGVGYVLCWTDASGRARATVEHPNQVAVSRDPVTREIVSAVKRVRPRPLLRRGCITPTVLNTGRPTLRVPVMRAMSLWTLSSTVLVLFLSWLSVTRTNPASLTIY